MIDQDKLEALRREYEEKLLRMQSPGQAEAMHRLMDASEDEIRQFLGAYYDSPEGRAALGQKSKGRWESWSVVRAPPSNVVRNSTSRSRRTV